MLEYGHATALLREMASAQTIDDVFGPPGRYEELKQLLDFEDDEIVGWAAEVLESVLAVVDAQDESYNWSGPLAVDRDFVYRECNWIENSMWLKLSLRQAQSDENRGSLL